MTKLKRIEVNLNYHFVNSIYLLGIGLIFSLSALAILAVMVYTFSGLAFLFLGMLDGFIYGLDICWEIDQGCTKDSYKDLMRVIFNFIKGLFS